MPVYEFECPECYRRISEIRAVKDRDNAPFCVFCSEIVKTRRVISAGTFKVNGFNEANGYSKCGEKT